MNKVHRLSMSLLVSGLFGFHHLESGTQREFRLRDFSMRFHCVYRRVITCLVYFNCCF